MRRRCCLATAVVVVVEIHVILQVAIILIENHRIVLPWHRLHSSYA